MGTRNLTVVVLDGAVKVAQYGQWDGYPTGQGKTICHFIQNQMKIRRFKKAISECSWVNEEEHHKKFVELTGSISGWMDEGQAKKYHEVYPQMNRDVGGEILEGIQNLGWRELQNSFNFGKDSLFCEWAYVVDLDNKVLEVYKGFNKNGTTMTERWGTLNPNEDGYYGVSLLTTIPFKEATAKKMEELEKQIHGEDED